ncbi:MAG: hypothetical protein H5T86_05910, partial [Armatimonadetes bacterium]|nr:hypothetical protein [Armatimonadota bacterium]
TSQGLIHINPGTVTYPLAKNEELKRRSFAVIADDRVQIIDLSSGEAFLTARLPGLAGDRGTT